ncbi:MAG: ABC transporter permease, partial [bacterium]|nr:ABC transporter permease [bacterium]
MRRHKGHSFINLTGLSIGLASCILLFLWIQDELNFDRYHDKAGRIYRVVNQYESDGLLRRSATTPAPLGPALAAEFPGIQKTVRFGENGFWVCYKNKCFWERVFFADPDVFDVFTFPMVQGDPDTALEVRESIVISEDMRDKYFGTENPLGKIINLKEKGDFTVTGVFKTIPRNSHFRFDFLGSFSD